MAVPTYNAIEGRQIKLNDKQLSSVRDKTAYGYQNFLSVEDFEQSLKTHIILDVAAPAKLYWQAPIGSIFIDTVTGTVYVKTVLDASSDVSRCDSWSSLDATVQAGDE